MIIRSQPWRLGDITRLYVTAAAGGSILLLGWWGTSGAATLHDQIAWINVAILGLIVWGAGIAQWLTAGRRAVGQRRRALLADPTPALEPSPRVDAEHLEEGIGRVVATAAMSHYHRTSCSLVAGKRARAASRARHEAAGRRPCDFCRP